jgi:HPt (histidine-containing phosphotransfer) domain-containing protein
MIKSLQRDYLASIPEKIKIIEEQIGANDQSNLRESFHKLKGTGKTYGIPEVSELGALVEAICIGHPVNSFVAGKIALGVLRDIHSSYMGSSQYAFSIDTRLLDLQKLLPK